MGERQNKTRQLGLAMALVAATAATDWKFENNIAFGFMYVFPMLLAGRWLNRWQIAAAAALCTGLTEAFDPFPWVMPIAVSRLFITFAAFCGAGLYGHTLARGRERANQLIGTIQQEVALRRQTEEQLEFLVAHSPATIFTLDTAGRVVSANEAAHRLLGLEKGKLNGFSIAPFFPALEQLARSENRQKFQTEMECRGQRADGQLFWAHIGFSTYRTTDGSRLAAVVFDTSEELRDRTEFGLQQVLTGSKMAVEALCHEIRNISGAIWAIRARLSRERKGDMEDDLAALGTLIEALEKMTAPDSAPQTGMAAEQIDAASILEDLRIVIEPGFEEMDMTLHWEIMQPLRPVWADRHALLQVFLNLAKNSQRAMEKQRRRELTVRACEEGNAVVVRFIDTGVGLRNPELLFSPFQPGASATGLGLYLSRAFLRAFQAEIRYEPRSEGCCFAVSLALASNGRAPW